MKLIYSPFYGGHTFVDLESRNGVMMGEKVVGTMELTEELRLRCGLASAGRDQIKRVVFYMKAIKSTLDNGGAVIFKNSFRKNELGVSMTLLGWRDALVELCWEPSKCTKSAKLNAIAEIEESFICPGFADDRRELIIELEAKRFDLSSIEIESVLPLELLPSFEYRLIAAAAECGAVISVSDKPVLLSQEGSRLRQMQEYLLNGTKNIFNSEKSDRSLRLLRFRDKMDALKYGALSDADVLVSGASEILREFYRARKLPMPKAAVPSDCQVSKLLPLTLVMRLSPLNVNALVAFLSVCPNPFGHIRVKRGEYFIPLNNELRSYLLGQGGLGTGWKQILEEDFYDYDGNLIEKKSYARYLKLVSGLGQVSRYLNKDEVLSYIHILSSWASKDMEERGVLCQYCNLAELLLEDLNGEVNLNSLLGWLDSLGNLSPDSKMPAELGSCELLDTPSKLVDNVSSFCWADCYTFDSQVSDLDFLSPADIKELKIKVDKADVQYKAQRYALAVALAKVKDSALFLTCDKDGEEIANEYPIITELKSVCGLVEEKGSIDELLIDAPVIGLMERKIAYEIDSEKHLSDLRISVNEGGLKRKSESYSSLYKLINYPFDYVLDYILHWNQYGIESMPDISSVKGTAAHKYIEVLLKDANSDIVKAAELHERDYESRVTDCIYGVAAIMLLEENRLECNSFRVQLKAAVQALLNFISENNLKVEGTEVAFEVELPVIGLVSGRIDLLLMDSEGNSVVVDMKWNEGTGKSYRNRLESGHTLQLALYRKALESMGRTVACEGYFLLAHRKFLYGYDNFQESEIVERIPSGFNGNLFEMVCNSYTYRIAQIERGIIEDAEGADVADIQYCKDEIRFKLYPLERDYNDDKRKGTPYGNTNAIMKGGVE